LATTTLIDLLAGLEWLNTPPLRAEEELRGKILVLDFWTFCCINCMHLLPELAALEEKYAGQPVLFIGVHSPKFSYEQQATNVQQAIARYGIRHPVVNDPELLLWRRIGISGWPTIILLSPAGEIFAAFSGEGSGAAIDADLRKGLRIFADELIAGPPLVTAAAPRGGPLLFPGKIAATSDRLFIADSGHNRILVTDFEGQIVETIGSGHYGLINGPFQTACFSRPQGLSLQNERLFIADTESHTIRLADLKSKRVTTTVGTGVQGHDRIGEELGRRQPLNSPWDLALRDDLLFIAMAGLHQLWIHELSSGQTFAWSGTGAEAREDGLEAAWAQPSGLALEDHLLYVADSESSSIRVIDLDTLLVETLAGGDMLHPYNLFAFGDREGSGFQARLQHPLGVAYWFRANRLVVADSYNHQIKLLDPETSHLERWVGSGQSGHVDGDGRLAQFWEPSGLAFSADESLLFVADTNNDAIRCIDTASGVVSTIEVQER
jgi:DNA-binding beta-propeller fold protein YncE